MLPQKQKSSAPGVEIGQRQRSLLARGFVAQSLVDSAKRDYDTAVAQRAAAEERWDTLEEQQAAQRREAEARVAQMHAAVETARANAVQVGMRGVDAGIDQRDAHAVAARLALRSRRRDRGETVLQAQVGIVIGRLGRGCWKRRAGVGRGMAKRVELLQRLRDAHASVALQACQHVVAISRWRQREDHAAQAQRFDDPYRQFPQGIVDRKPLRRRNAAVATGVVRQRVIAARRRTGAVGAGGAAADDGGRRG